MAEFIEALEQDWYRVDVAGLGEFVLRAYDEDFAKLRVNYYCLANPYLGIQPQNSFAEFVSAKPLEPMELVHYEAISVYEYARIWQTGVRHASSQPPPKQTNNEDKNQLKFWAESLA